ncbi:MAG: hypothetical protein ABI680_17710 [Chthoniobacteraceae bacterium]
MIRPDYARTLSAWLQANSGLLPRSLALDGKSVGNGKCGMIITLCRHEDGRPVAMIPASGKKEDCEVSEARALLESDVVELAGALITADPLHHNAATAAPERPSTSRSPATPCWPSSPSSKASPWPSPSSTTIAPRAPPSTSSSTPAPSPEPPAKRPARGLGGANFPLPLPRKRSIVTVQPSEAKL